MWLHFWNWKYENLEKVGGILDDVHSENLMIVAARNGRSCLPDSHGQAKKINPNFRSRNRRALKVTAVVNYNNKLHLKIPQK